MNASRLAVPVPRHRDCRGFTLLELLAVMAIIGVLSAIAVPRIRTAIDQARVAKAIGDIKNMQTDLQAIEASGQPLPATLAGIGRAGLLDPWGNPYVYVVFPPGPPPGSARQDAFAVPVNSTFDLYSLGKDGMSSPSFLSPDSRDDVVRANDGGFIGLVKKF